MNLQGISHLERGRGYIVAHRWSQCYWGRYNKRGPRYAQALSGRTAIWARHQPHNKNRRPK
jgi:hypothetical protein